MGMQLRTKGVCKYISVFTARSLGFIITSLLPLLLLPLILAPSADAIGCADPGSPCVNGVCNTTTGSCLCPANGYLAFTDRCDNISVISVTGNATNLTQSSTSLIQSARVSFTGTVFQGGFPISEGVLATSVFICSNGYVTMNSNFCTCRVDLLLTNATASAAAAAAAVPAFVAPLATSFDYRSSVGSVNASRSLVSYQLVASVDSEPSLRAMRENNSELAGTTAAIVVTWSKMSPATLDFSAAVQWITTQLILFTDRRTTTVAAMLYSENTLKHYFDWLPTIIGWKAGGVSSSPVTLAGTRSSAVAYATQVVSVGGSGNSSIKARLRLITLYKNATAAVNYRALCVDESLSPLSVPLAAATVRACPQTWRQARSDPRYIKEAAPPADRQTASLLVPSAVENATQLTCVYHNATGGLLVQESTVKIVSKNVSLGAAMYDNCCVRAPELCQLYYNKFPQPSSAGYVRPTLAGFVTGAGLFKTFDSLQYKHMDAGDFWLLTSATMNIQIRMQTVNLAANNTAVVTAAAVQFTGLTNFTLEVHWNKSAGRIESWHYTVNGSPYVNVTALSTTQTAVVSNAVATGTNIKLVCYTANSATWVEVLSGFHGLTATAYIDKVQLGVIAGPLGNGDGNSTNDVAYKNGTVLGESQLSVQTAIDDALVTWSAHVNESLFRVSQTPPVREVGWAGLYWNTAWDTNRMALCQALFQGNATVCNASTTDACGSKPGNMTAYRHCVLEFADCQPAGATCSAAYLAQLDATVPNVLADLACSPPQWNATATGQPVSLVDGVAFSLALMTLTAAVTPSDVVFSKVAGPPGLTVLPNGSLTWLPNQTEAVAPIWIGLANSAAAGACVSLWPVRVRLTRRAGLCPGNATEGFGFQAATASATAVTQQNQVTVSSCVCNANRYGTDCSFATCQLDCCQCDTAVPTNCSATCPANYDASLAGSLTVCAYRDRCDLSACVDLSSYTGCISLDPTLQTDTYKYQCTCTKGNQYPLANPNDKTRCEDIDECQFAALCDTTKNRTCQNSPGSFNCSCSPGYASSDGLNCLDIDECQASNGTVCQNAICSNTAGSYRCSCNSGFYQETSQRCTDIDECASPGTVNCTHQCNNTNGGFNCSCFSGYEHPSGNAILCQAQTACAANSTCTYKDLCAKVNGTDVCRCMASQSLTGSSCSPMTYCTPGICGPNANCTEANPGYACSCAQHYELNSTRVCVKSQYCTDPTKYPGVCPAGGPFVCSVNSTTNAPTCACSTGYALSAAGSAVCVDIDECANATANACQASSTDCRNTAGSYVCKCRIGYRRVNATHCVPAPHVYQIAYTYADQVYTADLATATTDAFKRMADLLEKRIEAALPPDGASSATARVFSMAAGSVVATTVAAYGTATSADAIRASASSAGVSAVVAAAGVNECIVGNDCSVEHNCVKAAVGYQCQCKIGYTQIGTRASFPATTVIADCVDIDECLSECRNTTATGGNKTCVNTPGSYICSCANGTYSPDPKTGPCQDPCVPGRCLNGGVCQYQVSDQFPYKCVCTAGFVGVNCELTDDHYAAMQRNAIIIGVVLGALLLIALIIVIICVVLKTRQREAKQSTSSRDDTSSTMRLQTRDAATAAALMESPPASKQQLNGKDLHANDASFDRPSEGNYRGRQQPVAMAETSIPRVQQSAKHPSSFENRGFENEASGTRRPRSDYF